MSDTTLQFKLFGKFVAFHQGEPIESLEASKVQELLAYLLLHRAQPHSRESLAEVLWEANSTSQAKKYLRQTLWQLQSALPDDEEEQVEPLLIVETDWIHVNPEASYALDVAALEDAYAQAQDLPGNILQGEKLEQLERAVAGYHGDVLQGWYQDWALFERERLQNMYLTLLDKLMQAMEASGRPERGIAYAQRSLRTEPARERSHYAFMRLLYLAGDRSGALRQYERCVQRLADDLGVEPAQRTQELYQRIANDQPLEIMMPAMAPAQAAQDLFPTEFSSVIQMVYRLDAMIDDLKQQLKQDPQRAPR